MTQISNIAAQGREYISTIDERVSKWKKDIDKLLGDIKNLKAKYVDNSIQWIKERQAKLLKRVKEIEEVMANFLKEMKKEVEKWLKDMTEMLLKKLKDMIARVLKAMLG